MQSFQRCWKSPWPPQAQRRKTLSLSAKVPRKVADIMCFENIADDCRWFSLWVAKIAGVAVASIPGSHVFCLPSREVRGPIRKSRDRPITYHPDNPTCHRLPIARGRPAARGPYQVETRLAHALITIPLFSAKTSTMPVGIQSRQSLTPPSLQKTRTPVHPVRPLRRPMEQARPRPRPSVGSRGGCYRRRPRPLPVYGSSPVIA